MAVSIENGKYFRIPMDKRDLNYDIYFIKGQKKLSSCDEYSSDNTNKLSRKELKKLLLSLDYIKKKLNA